MIKYLIFILFCLSAHASVLVEMDFSVPEVKQGEIVEARFKTQDPGSLDVRSLKGNTFGKTIYVHKISPLMKREGLSYFETSAEIVFIQVPQSYEVQDSLGKETVIFNWGKLKILPTTAEQKLIFGNITLPEVSLWTYWLTGGVLAVLLLLFLGWIVNKKLSKKKVEREKLLKIKNEILGCKTYDDIVSLWKKKQEMIQSFSHIEEPFGKLEHVLNKYQFKPKQSEAEKSEVVESYRKFSRAVEGGFNGI